MHLVRDPDVADDLTQEVWLRAARSSPRSPQSPRGWLATVLRRLAIDRGRANKTRRAAGTPVEGAAPAAAELAAQAELHRRVTQAVLELPEPYRSTVLMRYVGDVSLAEVAQRQGVPLETVRTRLKRAMPMIRKRLDAVHGGDRGRWVTALAPLVRGPHGPPGGAALTTMGGLAVMATKSVIAVGVAAAVIVAVLLLLPTETPETEPAHEDIDETLARERPPELRLTADGRPADRPPAERHRFGSDARRARPEPTSADTPANEVRGPGKRERLDVVVRDVFDGSPVRDVSLLRMTAKDKTISDFVRSGRKEGTTLEADEEGRFVVEGTAAELEQTVLVPAGTAWHGAARMDRRPSAVWVSRPVATRVTVRSTGAPIAGGIKVSYQIFDTKTWAARRPAGLPDDWFRSLSLKPFEPTRQGAQEMAFEGAVPRTVGMIVAVWAEGFLDAWQRVELGGHEESVDVDIVLRPAPRLTGSILDEVGAPVADVRTRLRVVVPIRDDETVRDYMWGVQHSCTVAGGTKEPHMRFEYPLRPDAKGKFAVQLPIEGHVTVRAWREGYEPGVLDLGTVSADRHDLALVLTALRGTALTEARVVSGGKKILAPHQQILIWKIEGTAVTQTLRIRADAAGRIPVTDFERGMRYQMMRGWQRPEGNEAYRAARLGRFVWEEQDPIELGR